MTKNQILFFILCVGIFFLPLESQALFYSTKVTLLVVDEEGTPLEGIDTGVAFEKNINWGTKVFPQNGLTDSEGKVAFWGQSNGHIAYGVENDKYYPSYYDYDFKSLGTFGWEPWNPELKLVMRKIENPVPMYARNVESSKKKIELPTLGKEVGFDLENYDWVAPYGSGKTVDFIFQATKSVRNKKDFDVKVTLKFQNKGDGIISIDEDLTQGSEFKLPRYAPEEGYLSMLVFEEHQKPKRNIDRNFNPDASYIFRVRSKYLDNELIEAKYGKIRGQLFLDANWTETVRIYFTYYFNPDGTRNLEFDRNNNLFKDLSPMERVKNP